MDIFGSREGKVVVLRNRSGGSRALLSLNGLQDVVVQRIGVARQVNAQFSPSLSDAVYLFVFGDKVGQAEVSGITFLQTCSGSAATGFSEVYDWYSQNKVSEAQAQAAFSVAGKVLRGYVLSLQLAGEHGDLAGLGKFTIRMAVVE